MNEEKTPRQELRHKECNHLLALVNDNAIELMCDCKVRVVVDIATLQAMIAAAKSKRKVEIAV